MDQCRLSGVRASQKAQAGGRTAADHRAAQRRIAGGCLAGDNGGGGIPGAGELYVQRPAGAGNQEAQARRDGLGPSTAGNLDGSEPRYYLSQRLREDTPLETLAYVGGSRWRIETEFETEKSDVGLDEYRDPDMGGMASPRGPVPAGAELFC